MSGTNYDDWAEGMGENLRRPSVMDALFGACDLMDQVEHGSDEPIGIVLQRHPEILAKLTEACALSTGVAVLLPT